ncbi:hypothetical protein AAG906_022578 [Vitis piasezkii]
MFRVLQGCPSMIEEVTRGPIRVLPCGQSRGGTHGRTQEKSHNAPLAFGLRPHGAWIEGALVKACSHPVGCSWYNQVLLMSRRAGGYFLMSDRCVMQVLLSPLPRMSDKGWSTRKGTSHDHSEKPIKLISKREFRERFWYRMTFLYA